MAKKELTDKEREEIPNLTDQELFEKIDNQKHEEFAYHYVRTNNQAHAAIAAGYTKENARNTGYLIMRNSYVRELVRRKKADIAKEIGVTPIMLAQGLKNIATASINDFNTDWDKRKAWKDVDVEKLHAVSELFTTTKTYTDDEGNIETTTDVKLKLKDSQKATEQLREMLGWKEEKKEEKKELDYDNIPPEELAILAKHGLL